MTDIKKLVRNIDVILFEGEDDPVITNIEFDSRRVTPGTLFVAVKGTKSDGHDYINSAITSGASAVICESLPENRDPKICWIKTSDSAKALGVVSSAFFGDPSSGSEACRGYRNKWKDYHCNPALQDVYRTGIQMRALLDSLQLYN